MVGARKLLVRAAPAGAREWAKKLDGFGEAIAEAEAAIGGCHEYDAKQAIKVYLMVWFRAFQAYVDHLNEIRPDAPFEGRTETPYQDLWHTNKDSWLDPNFWTWDGGAWVSTWTWPDPQGETIRFQLRSRAPTGENQELPYITAPELTLLEQVCETEEAKCDVAHLLVRTRALFDGGEVETIAGISLRPEVLQ